MVDGLETRQVIPSGGPSGQANVPVRQLGMVSVQAPRGGDMSQVGAAGRALAEGVRMGGQALQGYLDKKRSEDEVTGAMLRAQGKSEQDMADAGYNRHVLKGYQTLKMKTGYSEWYAKAAHDAINEHAGMDSTEYQKTVLMPQLKEVMNGLDPNDSFAREMFQSMGSEGFGKLVSKQVEANTEFLDSETTSTISSMLFADASTGDPAMVQESVELYDEFDDVHPDKKRLAAMNAIVPQLKEGNFMLYDAFGGSEGLRDRGFSPAQMESITLGVKSAQAIREEEASIDTRMRIRDIKTRAKTGDIGPQQAQEELAQVQQEMLFSEDFVRSNVNEVIDDLIGQQDDVDKLAIMHDDAFVQALTQFTIAAAAEGNTEEITNLGLLIADKFKLPHDMVMGLMETARNAQDNIIDTEIKDMERHTAAIREQARKEKRASHALSNGTIHELDPDEQQISMAMQRNIVQQSSDKPEDQADLHVEFLRTTSVVDKEVARVFALAGSSHPLVDGKVSPAVESSLHYFLAMRQGGVSESTLKKYAGDTYDYFNTAAFLQNGSMDPTMALTSAWELTRIPEDQKPAPRTKVSEVKKKVDHDIANFFKDLEPSMWASIVGAPSDGLVTTSVKQEVRDAFKNSDSIKDWSMRRAEEYTNIYSNMRPEGIANMVKKDLSRWELVAGTMVPPMNGQAFREMLGITDIPEVMASTTAVYSYVHDNKEALFPDITLPTSGSRIGYQGRERTRLPMDVRPLSNNTVLITVYAERDTRKRRPLGTIAVPATEIGDHYKQVLKDIKYE